MLQRLLLLAAALTLAACNKPLFNPAPKQAHPGLWVVRDADTTIYLFGSIHVLKPGVRWLDGAMLRALNSSDELVLELIQPVKRELGQVRRELAVYRGSTLAEHISPQTMAKVRAMMIQRGHRPDALDRFEPWYVAILVAQLNVYDTAYRRDYGVEPILTRYAARIGKPVIGLETLREQFGYFDRLPPRAQETFLLRTLDNLPHAKARYDMVTDAWAAGDTAKLAQLVNEELRDSPELVAGLVDARNRHWADWIGRRMAKPGTVFFAVGAGHLAGPQSLQAELTRRGYKVERVPD